MSCELCTASRAEREAFGRCAGSRAVYLASRGGAKDAEMSAETRRLNREAFRAWDAWDEADRALAALMTAGVICTRANDHVATEAASFFAEEVAS